MRVNLTTMLAGVTTLYASRFSRKTHHLKTTQTRFLHEVMSEVSGTAIGTHLGLKSDMSVQNFRRSVPVQKYSDFAPFATRLAQGEKGVVTNHPALYVAVSTGTTGQRKMIPITKKTHAARQRAHMAAAGFMVRAIKQRGSPLGRLLVANGAAMLGKTDGGVPYGFTSACERQLNRNKYRGRTVTPYPFEALTVPDFSQRCLLCFLFAIREPDLRFISGNFPPFLTQMASSLANDTPMVMDMLRHGGVPEHIEMSDDMRRRFNRMLPPDPMRADYLERAMGSRGVLTPDIAWPNLSGVLTGFGEASLSYLPNIREAFGPLPIFGGVYSATEALFGVHTDLDDHSTTLAIETGFFEFIPEEEWDAEEPETLLPHELEEGRLYRIVTTNLHGLCRHDIGDVIRVTGWHNETPRITFVRRKDGILSAAHEMTNEGHIDRALSIVSKSMSLRFGEVGVTLEKAEIFSSYLWLIELEQDKVAIDLSHLANALDVALGTSSPAYQTWRDAHVPPPQVAILPKGSINQFLGRPEGATTDDRLKPHRILLGKPHLETLIAKAVKKSPVN